MCQSCEAATINGVLCHEIGCPDSWKDETRECSWCGLSFTPEDRGQQFCEPECFRDFHGLSTEPEIEEDDWETGGLPA